MPDTAPNPIPQVASTQSGLVDLGSKGGFPTEKLQKLAAEDAQFRAAFPIESVVTAKREPGLRLVHVVQAVMEGYAERPALGQRVRESFTDPATGRTTLRLLPAFETVTYRELWSRASAIASAWHHDKTFSVQPGDFVCILGFTSIDYATVLLGNIHLGAVNVPLQTSAPPAYHRDIMAETNPRILAASIDYLDAAIDALLLGFAPQFLIVTDFDQRDDDQRDKLANARQRLASANCPTTLQTLAEIIAHGATLPPAPLYVPAADEDPLAWLFYTSGSTGTPKGAIFAQSHSIGTWLGGPPFPAITLSFMPMSHLVGNGYLLLALANGGTSYCCPNADLSTLFEDFSLVRPTMASLVPRVCELFYHHYLGELDRRMARGADARIAETELKQEIREKILGGRLLTVGCGSASLAPETYAFMESMLGMHMAIGYSATEIAGGTVYIDGKIQRPPVIAYRLDDVPELGYFNTDKPHPRGELLVKTDRFMGGYYKRPDLTAEKLDSDGFYRTGDIMAELGPDHLMFLDRRNNVIKLSQGEFVAISRLEALYSHSSAIRQIYIYGTSERAFLLAVVVPTDEAIAEDGDLKTALRRALHGIAEHERLNSYEIPRDFLIEREMFGLKNGLLTEVGKHQRPKLKERYAEKLESLYLRMAQEQRDELRALRQDGAGRPVLETVLRALQATLGTSTADATPQTKFSDLGGDSLSAVEYSILLEGIFNVDVPAGVITNPAAKIADLAAYIEKSRAEGTKRPGFATVHQPAATEVHAGELKLEKFISADLLGSAHARQLASATSPTMLLTGATGYLGRFLALAALQRLANTNGKLILLVRGADAQDARRRVEAPLESDPALLSQFRALAKAHLEVVPGDLALPDLGLSTETWTFLAEQVTHIIHSGAHVNHVLPYRQLFTANVNGTAELIRLAITHSRKRFYYISTLGVNVHSNNFIGEHADIRVAVPTCQIGEGYANGYGISKWASEVLLREAFDRCALPVAVFRPGMILAHSHYTGQLNVPDMFTRLLVSLIATGIAPATFYAEDLSNGRPKSRYEGLPVDFLADAIATISTHHTDGFDTYDLMSPQDGDASLDTIVDWLIESGCQIERIPSYSAWLTRFETAMQALPESRRQQSLLAILDPYRTPQFAAPSAPTPAEHFITAIASVGLTIPPLGAPLIRKYLKDFRHLGLV